MADADAVNRNDTQEVDFQPVKQAEEQFRLAENENRAVVESKILVLLLLLGAGATLGVATFVTTTVAEDSEFRAQFDDDAYNIIKQSHYAAKAAFLVMESLSVAATSLVLFKNDTIWPKFTVDHFALHGRAAREQSKTTFIALSPIVEQDDRPAWEEYASSHQDWVRDGLEIQGEEPTLNGIPYFIHPESSGVWGYSPIWQMSPAPTDESIVNYNLFENDSFQSLAAFVAANKETALSKVLDTSQLFDTSVGAVANLGEKPVSLLLQPIFGDFSDEAKIVGHYVAVLEWEHFFENILNKGSNGLIIVFKDSCNDEAFTFEINGREVTYLGKGDHHEEDYDNLERTSAFGSTSTRAEFFYARSNVAHTEEEIEGHCDFLLFIYPSEKLYRSYITNAPTIYTAAVIVAFFLTSLTFVLYDKQAARRQDVAMRIATRTNIVFTKLFPKNIRDQIFADKNAFDANANAGATGGEQELKSLFKSEDDLAVYGGKKPVADLYLQTTVMFADISGFTAWSSVREPCQVFTLLEIVFHDFDQLANSRGVFKVETVGDCYVAVSGLPEANKDHAMVMAHFARDCMAQMQELVQKLEVRLGPDTADLAIRVGMHSGPVTAGVLRGDRARFQLFGDTMNTAARMQTTGKRDKIHISAETAELLSDAKRDSWVKLREDVVVAKGKGALQTFWLTTKHESQEAAPLRNGVSGATAASDDVATVSREALKAKERVALMKAQRLIDWNCELLLQLLKKIVARRTALMKKVSHDSLQQIQQLELELGAQSTALDEVCEIIKLPNFDPIEAQQETDSQTIDLGEKVSSQLRDFIGILASMYRDNPFHCFEHASHVTMSVSKLFSRIAAPSTITAVIIPVYGKAKPGPEDNLACDLHDHTYGITSDPLTQFSVVMAALILDVDHRGVPNFVLCKEDRNLAALYKEKSIAEQNSIDLAWATLMDPTFTELRRCIYSDEAEMKRFRQLLVNSVMATDILDEDLGMTRKNRWNKAFQEASEEGSQMVDINRKATIVIEHLIQASDVSHTMQHWHVYQKWNARLFEEMYTAYRLGRSDIDPSEEWYRREIDSFDNYIIPLTKKLKECGVFGVSSDEYLNYATVNRREWEAKGVDIIKSLVEKIGPPAAHAGAGDAVTGLKVITDTTCAPDLNAPLQINLEA